jgi:hypothetical protein
MCRHCGISGSLVLLSHVIHTRRPERAILFQTRDWVSHEAEQLVCMDLTQDVLKSVGPWWSGSWEIYCTISCSTPRSISIPLYQANESDSIVENGPIDGPEASNSHLGSPGKPESGIGKLAFHTALVSMSRS